MKHIQQIFELIKKKRFDIFLHETMHLLGLKSTFIPKPYILMIEPTNACNLSCPACPTGSGKMNRPRRMMSLSEFIRIIDQTKSYVHKIILWNYGEPFLNKYLLSMIRYATDNGLFVMTSTNGGLFRSIEFCHMLVQSGLQHLIVCLDGADQQTIAKYRKGANITEIINGIKYLQKAKASLNSRTPLLELQFIIMKHNEHQRYRIVHLAHELGVDLYCEKTVGIDVNDKDFQMLADEFLPTDLSLSQYEKTPDGRYMLKGKILNYCSWVYRRMVINADGTVVPCCYDLYSEHVMGNIFKDSLLSIWRNEEYCEFRRMIQSSRKSIAICNICPETRFNIIKSSSRIQCQR